MLILANSVPAAAHTVRLKENANGQFVANAEMNGTTVRVLVDTGASTVALSFEDARQLGFREYDLTFDQPVATANGTVTAATVQIERVEVGGIRAEDVDALVMPKGAMSGSLLGMSFLSRLVSFEVRDGVLYLRD